MIVIYHANCPDGFCAAWLFHRMFPDATYIPMAYGEPVPKYNNQNIYLLDFHLPREGLLELAKINRVTVMDHHKTFKEDAERLYNPNLRIIYDPDKSGARLTWEFLNESVGTAGASPFLVDYTEDRDLWRHNLPHTHQVNAAIRSYQFLFQVWDQLNLKSVDELRREGESIDRYRRQRIEEMKSLAWVQDFLGHEVPVVNCSVKDLVSEVAGELADPFAVTWFYARGRYSYSLRARGDFDVGALAKKMGGGGHAAAAGFESDTPVHGV